MISLQAIHVAALTVCAQIDENIKIAKDAEKASKALSKSYLDNIKSIGEGVGSIYQIIIAVVAVAIGLFLLKFLWNILASVFGGNKQLKEYRCHETEVQTPHEMIQQAAVLDAKGRHREAAEMFLAGGDALNAATVYAKLGERNHAAAILEKHNLNMDAAKLYEQIGRHKDAARCYALDGHYGEAAEALLEAGDEIEAAKNFEQIGETTRAADLYARRGLLQKAAELYGAAGEREKQAHVLDALVQKGVTQEMLNDEDVQKALEECKRFQSAATIYIKKGEFLKAILALVKGGQVDVAVDLYSKMHERPAEEIVSALNYGDKETAMKFAQFFLRVRDQRSAAKIFDNVGRYKEAGDLAERYGDHYYAGQMFQLAGEMARAAVCMERAKAYMEAAHCYEEVEDPAKAADMFYLGEKYEKALEHYKNAGDQAKVLMCLKQMGQAPGAVPPTSGVVAAALHTPPPGFDPHALGESIAGSDVMAALSRTQAFSALNIADLSTIHMQLRRRTCRRGEVLVESGRRSDGLYIIYKGSAEVYQVRDGNKITLTTLGAGEHFGEISALFDREATATVAAQDDLEVIFIPTADLETILVTNPAIGLKLYSTFARVLADRLARTNTLVDALQLEAEVVQDA
jgi:tetratricopeptide (TPR) repeat protein